jgi:glycosyltransferase involved in cell wall biosynthesis
MKISLIIPTFRPQSYLWECLDSVYAQTFSKAEFEVIIVLNGCKEPYDSQIKAWIQAHDDLNVQYIQTDVGIIRDIFIL